MRESFDAQHKESLEVLLDDVGTVVRGLEVAAAAQRFDLWFSPDPVHHDERMRRGLLGALVDDPDGCAIEPFRNTPNVAAVDDCVRKLANHRHRLAAAAERREPPTTPSRPWVIVFSPGDPLSARLEYGLTTPDWPGVYRSPRGTGIVLVVLSALPVTRDTLALRLLARGPTLRRAMRELAALRRDAWEHKLVMVLLRWKRLVPKEPTMRTQEEIEFMDDTEAYLDELERKAIAKGLQQGISQGISQGIKQGIKQGRNEGRNEGLLTVLVRQFERKLARSLDSSERAVLRSRLLSQGSEALSDLVLDLDASALAAWLAAPDAH